MGIRRYKPTSPGRRGATVSDFADLSAGEKPEKGKDTVALDAVQIRIDPTA